MILIQINLHLVERVGRHNIKVPGPKERAVKGTVMEVPGSLPTQI